MELQIETIEIDNFGCIEHLVIKPDILTVISGRNETGKTTVLNALKSLVDSKGDPAYIRKGTEKATVKVTLRDGIIIEETVLPSKTMRTVTHPKMGKISKPAQWIESIINGISFDPAGFLTAKDSERLEIFLQAMPKKVTAEQLAFLDPEEIKLLDLNKHALEVIGSKSAGLIGGLYIQRTEINREAKDKRTLIAEMRGTLPETAPAGDWAEQLRQLMQELTSLQNNTEERVGKIDDDARDAIQAQKDLRAEKQAQIDKELAAAIKTLETLAAERRTEARAEMDSTIFQIQTNQAESLKPIQSTYEMKRTELLQQIGKARANVDANAKAQATRNMMENLGRQAMVLDQALETRTRNIEKLEQLKTSLIADLPIPGLEIADGKLLVDGIPFDHVNDSEKHRIAVEIMRINRGELGLMVLDRAEVFDSESWAKFTDACKKAGVPIFAARVADTDLTITTEGPEA